MTKDEALQMCLEYIETDAHERKYVRHAIKAALEAKDKPVAWGVFEDGNIHDAFTTKQEAHHMAYLKGTHAEARPLYAAPPQRTWVGLTDEEIEAIAKEHIAVGTRSFEEFAHRIEAKLKEKNNG